VTPVTFRSTSIESIEVEDEFVVRGVSKATPSNVAGLVRGTASVSSL
jgi:hypothetical protein